MGDTKKKGFNIGTIKSRNALKILVVGNSGVGKSSLIRTLFSEAVCKGKEVVFEPTEDRVKNELNVIDGTPTENLKEYGPYYYKSISSELFVYVIDTPGINDNVNIKDWIKDMEKYLNDRHLKFKNNARLDVLKDPRITVILYVMSPMRLTNTDIFIIDGLSKAAPVIPLVGKSDTMNPREREAWKKGVYNVIKERLIDRGNTNIVDLNNSFIYSVMGSENGENREYGDGQVISIANDSISDIVNIHDLLFEKYHDIREMLENCGDIVFHKKLEEENESRKFITHVNNIKKQTSFIWYYLGAIFVIFLTVWKLIEILYSML